MQAVILAAGKGTRLRPLTYETPKPLVKIGDKPIIEYFIKSLKRAGVEDFVVVVGYLGEQIVDYLGDGSKFGVNIEYAWQEERLGMAHALKTAEEKIKDDYLLVAAADMIIRPCELEEFVRFHEEENSDATLALAYYKKEEIIGKMGNVEMDGDRILSIIEKPSEEELKGNIASLPLYIFNRKIFDYMKCLKKSRRGEYEIQDVIADMIKDSPILGKTIKERLHITCIEDLREAECRREFWE